MRADSQSRTALPNALGVPKVTAPNPPPEDRCRGRRWPAPRTRLYCQNRAPSSTFASEREAPGTAGPCRGAAGRRLGPVLASWAAGTESLQPVRSVRCDEGAATGPTGEPQRCAPRSAPKCRTPCPAEQSPYLIQRAPAWSTVSPSSAAGTRWSRLGIRRASRASQATPMRAGSAGIGRREAEVSKAASTSAVCSADGPRNGRRVGASRNRPLIRERDYGRRLSSRPLSDEVPTHCTARQRCGRSWSRRRRHRRALT